MILRKYLWPTIGTAAVAVSLFVLYHELRGLSLDEMADSLAAIPPQDWVLCVLSTLVAYAALAAYDYLALLHLRRGVSLIFITVCSFTTYALSHTIGASMFSGAVVRYRAYRSKGLSPAEIGVLVGFCSFTFVLGTVFLMAMVLLFEPGIIERLGPFLPVEASVTTGLIILALVGLYIAGSWFGFRPLKIGSFELCYPRPAIALRQLFVAPIELLGAAAIIYFALPEAGNPGFVVILGIFLASFSIALISHAPGGIGVLELVFLAGLPEMNQADVLAALVVFRLFYLIIPFVIALGVIVGFERSKLAIASGGERVTR